MTKSTDKLETRVDSAHHPEEYPNLPEADVPTTDLLKSIAGLGSETTLKQVCGQSIELAAHLQNKQKLLDRRESALNAKLAMFETEERASRIRDNSNAFEASHAADDMHASELLDCGIPLETSTTSKSDYSKTSDSAGLGVKSDSNSWDRLRTLSESEPFMESHRSRKTSDATVDTSELEAMHAALVERERRLARHETEVEKLYDQVTNLHRESLELRVATEQVWGDLGKTLTDEQLADQVTRYRSRLVDHFTLASDEIARRTRELNQQKENLQHQEKQLRRQRLDVQVWVDGQRDELAIATAELGTREAEINNREIQFQRQSALWQEQREEYRRQIEQLTRRVGEQV